MPVVAPQTHYTAADNCYRLSEEFQVSYNTLQATLIGSGATPGTSGMAGSYTAVEVWSRNYNERATALVTAATAFARALTHFGDILTVCGYNWEWAEYKANRDPNKGPGPTSPRLIPSELPYGAGTVVGVASSKDNGSGLESEFPELYDKIITRLAGGEIPDGDTDKLNRATEAWRRFADSIPVFGSESRLKGIAAGLSRYDAPDIPNLITHLGTLAACASEIRSAADDLATSTASHHTELVAVRADVNTKVAAIIVGASITIAVTAVLIRNPRALAVEGPTLDSAATAAAGAIGTFFTTLAGIQFSTAAITTTALATIAGLSIVSLAGDSAGNNIEDINGSATPFTVGSVTTSVGKIAQSMGATPKEVRDAIHSVKALGGWRGNGANRNPDVGVDTQTGEVYPKNADGTFSDESIGNVRDYLPDE